MQSNVEKNGGLLMPTTKRRPSARRLFLEGLEDRRLMAFNPAVFYPAGDNPRAIVAADFNRDGVADLATANEAGNISVLLGNLGGTFQAAQNTASLGYSALSLATGDFNRDGKLDLAAVTPANVDV